MLTRSISYLQALASLDLIFMRKLVEFHHGGSEYYYKCLMELKDYSKLLAITGSPTIIADDVWKQILKKQNPHALCDGAIDEADIGAGAAAPKRKRRKADALAVAVVADSALLEPMHWNFHVALLAFQYAGTVARTRVGAGGATRSAQHIQRVTATPSSTSSSTHGSQWHMSCATCAMASGWSLLSSTGARRRLAMLTWRPSRTSCLPFFLLSSLKTSWCTLIECSCEAKCVIEWVGKRLKNIKSS